MELKLKDGDYVPNGRGGFCTVEGGEELLQRVLFRLTARRGAFPLLPNLGSRLYLLPREKPALWQSLAGEYITEALEEEHELTVSGVTVTPRGDGGANLEVGLDWQGRTLGLTMEVDA
ncbi:MAG: hypothetical protein RSC89_04890 [Oscillospiraceae bacterium]